MTVYTAPDARLLAELGGNVAQLTRPIVVPVRQRGRRIRTTWTAFTHPSLLDQLRTATTGELPAYQAGPERHAKRASSPAPPGWSADASVALARIYVEVPRWLVVLDQQINPDPDQDWYVVALRALVGAAPELASARAAELADAVHGWWRSAAVQSGWSPAELLALRS